MAMNFLILGLKQVYELNLNYWWMKERNDSIGEKSWYKHAITLRKEKNIKEEQIIMGNLSLI